MGAPTAILVPSVFIDTDYPSLCIPAAVDVVPDLGPRLDDFDVEGEH